MRALTIDDLMLISSFVLSPPSEKKYEGIKKAILKEFGETETKRLNTVLSGVKREVDERPTRFLYRLRDLAQGKLSDEALRLIWINQLPDVTRPVVAGKKDESLDAVAQIADDIMDATSASTSHASTSQVMMTRARSHKTDTTVDELAQRVAAIERAHGNVRHRGNMRGRKFIGNAPRSSIKQKKPTTTTRNRVSNDSNNAYCWYHQKHGAEAQKCKSGCKWTNKNPLN